jgi:hypothetical protein
MDGIIERGIIERRSIEEALADLLAKYERLPTAELARMIRQLHAEIGERRAPFLKRGFAHRAHKKTAVLRWGGQVENWNA